MRNPSPASPQAASGSPADDAAGGAVRSPADVARQGAAEAVAALWAAGFDGAAAKSAVAAYGRDVGGALQQLCSGLRCGEGVSGGRRCEVTV